MPSLIVKWVCMIMNDGRLRYGIGRMALRRKALSHAHGEIGQDVAAGERIVLGKRNHSLSRPDVHCPRTGPDHPDYLQSRKIIAQAARG
jgi:hypothetical protein